MCEERTYVKYGGNKTKIKWKTKSTLQPKGREDYAWEEREAVTRSVMAERRTRGQQYAGLHQQRVTIRLREVISPLLPHFCNAFLRLHLECGAQVWGHQHKKDDELFKWIFFLLTRFHGRGTFLSSESDAVHHRTGQLEGR